MKTITILYLFASGYLSGWAMQWWIARGTCKECQRRAALLRWGLKGVEWCLKWPAIGRPALDLWLAVALLPIVKGVKANAGTRTKDALSRLLKGIRSR